MVRRIQSVSSGDGRLLYEKRDYSHLLVHFTKHDIDFNTGEVVTPAQLLKISPRAFKSPHGPALFRVAIGRRRE